MSTQQTPGAHPFKPGRYYKTMHEGKSVMRSYEDIRRDELAEAWDMGFQDGKRQDAEGDDGPRFTNPYRSNQ
jgi:hypothetical protein